MERCSSFKDVFVSFAIISAARFSLLSLIFELAFFLASLSVLGEFVDEFVTSYSFLRASNVVFISFINCDILLSVSVSDKLLKAFIVSFILSFNVVILLIFLLSVALSKSFAAPDASDAFCVAYFIFAIFAFFCNASGDSLKALSADGINLLFNSLIAASNFIKISLLILYLINKKEF